MNLLRPVIALALLLNVAGWAQDAPKKVTRQEALSAVVSKPAVEYPPIARQLKVSGKVELEALVSETGSVIKVTIVSGNPMLTTPAAESLKKWKFKPFTDEGKPVAVLAPVSFTFEL